MTRLFQLFNSSIDIQVLSNLCEIFNQIRSLTATTTLSWNNKLECILGSKLDPRSIHSPGSRDIMGALAHDYCATIDFHNDAVMTKEGCNFSA